MLLKVVLFAYSQGTVSSRGIEAVCRDHVSFIALSGDTQPHFTTFAAFREGLIGREMFAITLRGQKKVDAQWKLYCLVHIEKLAHHGYAQ